MNTKHDKLVNSHYPAKVLKKKKDRSINKSKQKYNGKVSNQNHTGIRKEESEDRDVNAKSVWFAAGRVKGCRKKHLGRKYSPTALRRNHSGTEKL